MLCRPVLLGILLEFARQCASMHPIEGQSSCSAKRAFVSRGACVNWSETRPRTCVSAEKAETPRNIKLRSIVRSAKMCINSCCQERRRFSLRRDFFVNGFILIVFPTIFTFFQLRSDPAVAVSPPAETLFPPDLSQSLRRIVNLVDDDGNSDDFFDVDDDDIPDPGEPGVNSIGQVYADGVDNDFDGQVDELIDEPSMPTLKALAISTLLAFIASAASTFIAHPIDTLKTRYQAAGHHGSRTPETELVPLVATDSTNLHPQAAMEEGCAGSSASSLLSDEASEAKTSPRGVALLEESAPTDGAVRVVAASGGTMLWFTGLYDGVVENMVQEALTTSIFLGLYEFLKPRMMLYTPLGGSPLLASLLTGAMADAVGTAVSAPVEIVKRRLQAGVSPDALSALRTAIFTEEGRRSSLSALGAMLLRDLPDYAIEIAAYEQIKAFTRPTTLFGDGMMGVYAGFIAGFLTTPADVIVTLISIRAVSSLPSAATSAGGSPAGGASGWAATAAAEAPERPEFRGIVATVRGILEEEGFLGLWKGCFLRAGFHAPLVGFFFFFYEALKALFNLQDLLPGGGV